jgi:hypothetical protein
VPPVPPAPGELYHLLPEANQLFSWYRNSGKQVCVLSGPSGCGKSALVQKLAHREGLALSVFTSLELYEAADIRTVFTVSSRSCDSAKKKLVVLELPVATGVARQLVALLKTLKHAKVVVTTPLHYDLTVSALYRSSSLVRIRYGSGKVRSIVTQLLNRSGTQVPAQLQWYLDEYGDAVGAITTQILRGTRQGALPPPVPLGRRPLKRAKYRSLARDAFYLPEVRSQICRSAVIRGCTRLQAVEDLLVPVAVEPFSRYGQYADGEAPCGHRLQFFFQYLFRA